MLQIVAFSRKCTFLSKNIKTYTCITVVLPLLYGCETWSLTLREEHKMRVSEDMVLRKIFGTKRDEVTGGGEKAT